MPGSFDRDEVLDQAIAWHQALAHDGADWDRFLDWLDAGPNHRKVYDQVALLDRAIDERAAALRVTLATRQPQYQAANDRDHASDRSVFTRWWSIGGFIAVAVACVAAAAPLFVRRTSSASLRSSKAARSL